MYFCGLGAGQALPNLYLSFGLFQEIIVRYNLAYKTKVLARDGLILLQNKENWISNNPFGIVIGFALGLLGCITAIDPPFKGGIGLIALYVLGVLGFYTLIFSSGYFRDLWHIPHILFLVLIGFFAGYLFDYLFMNMKRKRLSLLIIVFAILNTFALHIVMEAIAVAPQ